MKLSISLSVLFVFLTLLQPALIHAAGYSEWKSIRSINRMGRQLKSEKRVPFDIQCRSNPRVGGTSHIQFRLKTRKLNAKAISQWSIKTNKINNNSYKTFCRAGVIKAQSVSCVRPGSSGLGLMCVITHK